MTFVEVNGTVGETLPNPPDGRRTSFYFKFLPAPDGKGFDAEPSLVYCYRDETTRTLERVDGEVLLRESRFDPVADIPVRAFARSPLRSGGAGRPGRSTPGCPPTGCSPTSTSGTTISRRSARSSTC